MTCDSGFANRDQLATVVHLRSITHTDKLTLMILILEGPEPEHVVSIFA